MKDFLQRLLRHLVIGTLIGILAGFIAGGIGSRLAMRVTAMMTEATLQGTLTEAQARVGEITFGGTLFLLIFSAMLGVYAGLLYRILVAWIPAKSWQKGLGFGIFLLLLHGTILIEGDNIDFARFGSIWLNLAMFILIPVAFGLIAAYSEAWLERKYPAFAFRPKPILLYLPGLIGIFALLGLVGNHIQALSARFFNGIGNREQAWISLIVLALCLVTVIFEPMLKRNANGSQIRIIAALLPTLYGSFLLFQAISQILA